MGAAKRRGTYEQRRAEAIAAQPKAPVIVPKVVPNRIEREHRVWGGNQADAMAMGMVMMAAMGNGGRWQ